MKNKKLEKHFRWLRQRTATRKLLREIKQNPKLANPTESLVFSHVEPNTDSKMADLLDSTLESNNAKIPQKT